MYQKDPCLFLFICPHKYNPKNIAWLFLWSRRLDEALPDKKQKNKLPGQNGRKKMFKKVRKQSSHKFTNNKRQSKTLVILIFEKCNGITKQQCSCKKSNFNKILTNKK